MKRLLCLSFIALILAGPASAEKIEVTYTFDRPEIRDIQIGGNYYTRLVMTGCPNFGKINRPALPATGARILIPYGSTIEEIDIIPGEPVSLGSNYMIEPAAQPVKMSSMPGQAPVPVPDRAVYESSQPYPGELFTNIGVQSFRGYDILTLRLQPVQYVPDRGELLYYPDLAVTVTTAEGQKSSSLFRGLDIDMAEAAVRVDNPDQLSGYQSALKSGGKSYDLLIITTSTLAPSFQPLKDYHDTTGIITEIHTTNQVGSNNPDDIRAYITDRYLNDGIQYVLIGGDDDIIPAKDLYVISWEGTGNEIEYSMPSDIYFGCLDGTYNYDDDNFWGEPTDGDGGGDVDLEAEVFIGRASVSNTTEADRFVSKTLQYLVGPTPQVPNVLMLGEYLGFGGISDYAGDMMDQMVDGSSADGYTTVGIPSDLFSIDRLYDRDYPGNDWPSSELTSRINGGDNLHIINHLGHGGQTSALKLTNSTIMSSLTNVNHLFLYSQACLSGHFDGTDCFAEYMNIKSDYAAFAVIMNARYGWGSSYSTDGPSQRFDREFWDAIFNPAENKLEIARANHDSKEDNIYRIDESCMRWCTYELNLFGDPTITFRMPRAVAFDYPQGIPEIIPPDQTSMFQISVYGINDGVPVSGSGKLHYSIDGGAWQTETMTEIGTDLYEATLPAVECGLGLEFYISAEEETYGQFDDPAAGMPNLAVSATEIVTVAEDDFETDQGWTVSGDALDGHWDRGVPVGGGDRGDPASDFDGSGSCYLTDNVDDNSDVDDGTTYLDSPVYDLSEGDATIEYARWYSNNNGAAPYADVMNVYVSNDAGTNWTVVETVGPTDQADGGWYQHSFNVSDLVTPTSQVQVRFDASDLGEGSVVEAAIDAFRVYSIVCQTYMCGDANGDEEINIADGVFLINFVFKSGPSPDPIESGDANSDTNCDIADAVFLINYVFHDGPAPACP